MSDGDPIAFFSTVSAFSTARTETTAGVGRSTVAFDRHELREILNVYGRMVAAGEWRDYAIDHLKDCAVFSIFRRSSEVPLYRIEKRPKNAQRQGAYAVLTPAGMVLKRGHDLVRVLSAIEKRVRLVDL